jgi:Na+-translocating ferredoxin:NAD+ oxidoreductase RnfA subunit
MILSLMILSGLSFNMILQFGLGFGGINAVYRGKRCFSWIQWGILFLSVPVLWQVFSFISPGANFEFWDYFLLFPASVLFCTILEGAAFRIRAKQQKVLEERIPPMFNALSAYDGMTPTALLLTLRFAASPAEAALLSLGFSLGVLAAVFLLNEIHRRASMEAVPPVLRGLPLALISAGLLSLIFSAGALLFLNTLGAP